MTTTTDLALNVSRTINASPEALFNAWLDPATLARFMRPMADMPAPKVSNDPRVGGRFDILMTAGDKDIPHSGTYTEIVPHRHLAFTWQSPFSVEGSTVTLDFKPVPGGTQVDLTHVKFPSEESRTNHESGWSLILATLAEIG